MGKRFKIKVDKYIILKVTFPREGGLNIKIDSRNVRKIEDYLIRNPEEKLLNELFYKIGWKEAVALENGKTERSIFYENFKEEIRWLYAFLSYCKKNKINNRYFNSIRESAIKETNKMTKLHELFAFCLERAYGDEWSRYQAGKNFYDAADSLIRKHIYGNKKYRRIYEALAKTTKESEMSIYTSRDPLRTVLLKFIQSK